MANWVADFLTRNPDKAALPIALRAKHSIHFKRPDGQVEANFTGAPCHFQDTDGLWKPLDTKLIVIGSEYGAPGLKARIGLDGTARIEGGIYSHRSTRIGVFNSQTKKFVTAKTIPLGAIQDDKLIAENDVFKRVLTLTETGLREEIIISALPAGLGTLVNDWAVLETAITGVSFPDGWIDDFSADGFMFPPPLTSDAARNIAPCKRYARTVGGVQYIYTGVPVSWLADAVYPVTIDPDFVEDAADGYIYGSNDGTYATARSTSSVYNITATSLYIGQEKSGTLYTCIRLFLKFVTSAIGAGSTVTQNNLKMVCTADWSGTNYDIQIVKQDWSAQDPLSDANREAAYDNCLAGTADDSILGNTVDIAIVDGHYHFTSGNLSTTWVNKVGNTYYSLISSLDKAATSPTGTDEIQIASQENATEAFRPILTVVYTGGGASTSHFFSMF